MTANGKALLLLLMVLVPAVVMAAAAEEECVCEDGDEEHDRNKALRYKVAAIFAIFSASTIGVCIPMLGRAIPALSPDRDLFFVVKAFAAGVILATGFIHVLPDAFGDLTCSCLNENPWANFPFTGFVAMLAAIGVLSIDSYATSYYSTKKAREDDVTEGGGGTTSPGEVPVHSHSVGHGHSHAHSVGSAFISSGPELLRHRVIAQVLELGIIVHSVIIGIALGASESPGTIRPLVAALTFHQFFEGIGLGGCITQAKFKNCQVMTMTLLFSLTTSTGIIIGIGITNSYDENSPTALIVQGLFNAASAGILIYMSLVDLLAADFMSPRMHANKKLQFFSHVSLLVGAGCMSLLAKWA